MADIIKPARLTELLSRPQITYPAWIEPVILPKGGVAIFGGHSKIGKSFIALEMGRAVATGDFLFGFREFRAAEGRVLYLEREIGEYGLQTRGLKVFAGENLDRIADNVWYVSQDPSLDLDTHAGVQIIGDHIAATGANVVILDPISHMHSGDENDNTQMNKLFSAIEYLRHQFRNQGLSFVIAHHFGKPPNGKHADGYDHMSMHNFRGAGKFASAPDTICTAWRCEELNLPWEAWRLKLRWRCRQGESPGEMYLTVNQNQDLRVRWERMALENRVKPQETGFRAPKFSPGS